MESNTYESLSQAVSELQKRGYSKTFKTENTRFLCPETGETITPAQMTIVEHHRFEGKTDPDEMSVVYAVETETGTRGTIVDAFGIYADPELAKLISDVRVKEANAHQDAPGGYGNKIQPRSTIRIEGTQGTGPSTRD